MSNCAVCQAPVVQDTSTCCYAVPASVAPWRGDYEAMHRGDMTHSEHQIHVARWALHNPASQGAKSLAMFRALADAHAGQQIPVFEVGEARA
jgi:hypothetical protein